MSCASSPPENPCISNIAAHIIQLGILDRRGQAGRNFLPTPSVALVKVFHETIWALLDIAACMLHAACNHSRGAGLDDGKVLEAGCVFQPRLLAFGKALHTTSDFGVYGGPCTL